MNQAAHSVQNEPIQLALAMHANWIGKFKGQWDAE